MVPPGRHDTGKPGRAGSYHRVVAHLGDQLTESRYRLPRHVVPHRYDLTIQPDLDEATFTGRVDIAITIGESTEEIVLNAIELELTEITLTNGDGEALTATVTYEEDTGTSPAGVERRRGARRLDSLYRFRWHPQRQTAPASTGARSPTTKVSNGPSPPPSSKRPTPASRVPVLGRTGVQGSVRNHAGRRAGPAGRLQRSRGRPARSRRRQGGRSVRRHDEDVDLPGCLCGRRSRGDRTRRRRRYPLARRARTRQGPPDRVCA